MYKKNHHPRAWTNPVSVRTKKDKEYQRESRSYLGGEGNKGGPSFVRKSKGVWNQPSGAVVRVHVLETL